MLGQARAAVERLRARAARDPRPAMAVKAAVAAALAWLLVQPLGGAADRYPFYAPLGAVVATTTTVASTVRTSRAGVLAIAVGGSLALTAQALDLPNLAALALVVGIGTLLAGWPRVAEMNSWVPASGLFVLTVGHHDPLGYTIGYLCLTALGVLVGTLVNMAFPSMPVAGARDTEHQLRDLLAAQLEDLADGLDRDEPLTREEWGGRVHGVAESTGRMRQMVAELVEAQEQNWRARRWRGTTGRHREYARALEQVAFLVEDVTILVSNEEAAEREDLALGSALRPAAAATLAAMAALLCSVEDGRADAEQLARTRRALDRLVDAVRRGRTTTQQDYFAAGSIVVAVRRALDSLSPVLEPAER